MQRDVHAVAIPDGTIGIAIAVGGGQAAFLRIDEAMDLVAEIVGEAVIAKAIVIHSEIDVSMRYAGVGGNVGIGMPAELLLKKFGMLVRDAFGCVAYQVGSSIRGEKGIWRDVDVRIMMSDEEYRAKFGDPDHCHSNPAWVAQTLVWSSYGRLMTGLPIDFQIQSQGHANTTYPNPRSALVDISVLHPHKPEKV